ncbi:hypothetical protein HC248_01080 [Polaromonas vacuolata]|uniref:Uncharacterized protein n=1 Tax=Polaromonas vacuolata TaxID=37448 RepID=A0A6H2H7Q2_9BURK|nr:hypothetical protein [Polaromonas vacuolata]QJC55797.1 hypothetical protein HC248_01080 [Polaromonas vacuolata]
MVSIEVNIKLILIGVVLLFGVQSGFAESADLPTGWRLPTNLELSDAWRNDDLQRFAAVKGDFNGDGFLDQAMILVSDRGNRLGLFVFLSQIKKTEKVYKLDEIKDKSFLQVTGLNKVSAGKYKTACGKGYWNCKDGELSEIKISNDAVSYFKKESASSYFWWNKRSNSFVRTWMSD